MKLNLKTLPEKTKENFLTGIYIGFFFVLLAVIYYANIHISLWNNFVNFINNFVLATVPGTSISLPTLNNPSNFVPLYNVAFQFCLGLGIMEIGILALRVWLNSPLTRKAETIENMVFWLGTSYLVLTYLVNISIPSEWFVFWAGIILIGGLSLVARSFVLIANR